MRMNIGSRIFLNAMLCALIVVAPIHDVLACTRILCGISITRLKIDPVWDPIRNRPDFQQLLSGPEQIGPNK
jgi:hypothetical protein